MKYCSECGSELRIKAKFCPECGASITGTPIAKNAGSRKSAFCACEDQTYVWIDSSGNAICNTCEKVVKGKKVDCEHNIQVRAGRRYCDKCHYFLQAPDDFDPESVGTTGKDFFKVTSALLKLGSAIVVIAVVILIYHSLNPSTPVQSTPQSGSIYLTQDAYDGQFKFQVTAGPKCGIPRVGDGYSNAVAKGQFCSIRIWVTNKSDKPATFFDSNQKVYDAAGNEYSASTEADLTAHGAISYASINPGLNILGDVYFDLPSGVLPDHAVLHDSTFSDGVNVSLQNDPAVLTAVDSPSPSATIPTGYEKLSLTWGWKWGANPPACPAGKSCTNANFVLLEDCSKGFKIDFNQYSSEKSGIIVAKASETWKTQIRNGVPTHILIQINTPDNVLRKYPDLALRPTGLTCSN